ncbi:MAG: hypothetical protein ETSY2_22785 [Candidatus Entotheonella gemina]|uniref:MalT-like TPR region domain-containing protein n=1 Tax=Candidatus Entotheonella gemina TaxID=1429439 RepID=W4M539_9BACT|nr:MAG: hypothetical protein ETSY2_22785 [Candidatus Entotheonella gemina]
MTLLGAALCFFRPPDDIAGPFWPSGGRWRTCRAAANPRVGLGQMQSGLALARQIGFQLFIPDGLLVLAQCYLQAGQLEDGFGSLTEAAQMSEQSKMRAWEAEWYRLRGEFLLARARQRHLVDVNQPDQREADGCFQRALEIASQQGAKSWALRVAMSQCRLWQQQGLVEDAYRALKTLYGEFTEGFATQDLQEAKALLAELAASQCARGAFGRLHIGVLGDACGNVRHRSDAVRDDHIAVAVEAFGV